MGDIYLGHFSIKSSYLAHCGAHHRVCPLQLARARVPLWYDKQNNHATLQLLFVTCSASLAKNTRKCSLTVLIQIMMNSLATEKKKFLFDTCLLYGKEIRVLHARIQHTKVKTGNIPYSELKCLVPFNKEL